MNTPAGSPPGLDLGPNSIGWAGVDEIAAALSWPAMFDLAGRNPEFFRGEEWLAGGIMGWPG